MMGEPAAKRSKTYTFDECVMRAVRGECDWKRAHDDNSPATLDFDVVDLPDALSAVTWCLDDPIERQMALDVDVVLGDDSRSFDDRVYLLLESHEKASDAAAFVRVLYCYLLHAERDRYRRKTAIDRPYAVYYALRVIETRPSRTDVTTVTTTTDKRPPPDDGKAKRSGKNAAKRQPTAGGGKSSVNRPDA